jgi:hypothetical protein
MTTVIEHTDEDTWHEARRKVVTATQIRDWTKGRAADRARILIQKVTGAREDLSAVKYIEWGNFREPFLQDWVETKYGIAPIGNDLYVSSSDPRWACTPDGYSEAFGEIVLSEIKTSKHDLNPTLGYFLDTAYEDQMQWEMLVSNANRCLFVWEQHDDNWDPWPTPFPPQAVWMERDNKRIGVLVVNAEVMLEHVTMWVNAYAELVAKCTDQNERDLLDAAVEAHIAADYTVVEGLEDRWLFAIGGDRKPLTDDPLALGALPDDLAELAQIVIDARAEEAAAKKRKEEAWAKIQEATAEHEDFKAYGNGVGISWSTSTTTKPVLDRERMIKRAPSLVKQYEALVERYTKDEPVVRRTMNVSKQTD